MKKMRHCWFCGAELGVYADYDPLDNCGSRECVCETSHAIAAERDEAHRQLDEDRGW